MIRFAPEPGCLSTERWKNIVCRKIHLRAGICCTAQPLPSGSLKKTNKVLPYRNQDGDPEPEQHFSNLNKSLGAESKINSLCVFQSPRIGVARGHSQFFEKPTTCFFHAGQ
jgi:hypothetical protein